ncbi:hypothetical protein GALMADRAFT_254171 [Galerina marginata CBS 339.88]|uniref:ABC transporter domain-containing protein n=1 Tax=Galerina marginata (strain CBS 339.88) TaxID=685588 RepID=A0A067SJG5_GALM3|nr:hypothetical protein GALMADRAFT_254171 [Galerina marginata CBS 339.88]
MPVTTPFLQQTESSWLFASHSIKIQAFKPENNARCCFPFGEFLLLQAAKLAWKKSHINHGDEVASKSSTDEDALPTDISSKIKRYAQSQGGLTLFALSVATLLMRQEVQQDTQGGTAFQQDNIPEISVAITYRYTSLLAAASFTRGSWHHSLTRHTNIILLSALTVYLYRDVWPPATFTKVPMDLSEGRLLWAKLAFIPRQYVPIDPKNPMKVLNAGQTASLFSLMVYTFLDPVIFETYRVPHLPADRLPILADYDYGKNLTARAFPHLDHFHGAKKRHLFFGLIRPLWEYLGMAIAIILQVFASFASPLALNRILAYVVCLFFGPLLVSICFQAYFYLGTMALARTQAILTELVFEQSLRTRFKAETGEGGRTHFAAPTPAQTPDNRSIAGSSTEDDESQSVRTETSAAKGKGKAEPAPVAKTDNLVGKINTLVTVDLDNITNSKDILMLVLQVPLELTLAVVFLYDILGWSAIVGFASIVMLLPVPAYIAIERTDARVQTVTETIGVLRMIKLFGLENKMRKAIKEKRDEELGWIWKDKMINLLNDAINFIIPTTTMLVTYATYNLIMKQSLNASKVFSSMAVFDIVRNLLHRSSWILNISIKGKASLERVGAFLRDTELLDRFSDETESAVIGIAEDTDYADVIGLNNATFSWSNDVVEDGAMTPSSRSFRLRIEGGLAFKKGCINLIVGPTGSGKTSVLMPLLGEMHFILSTMDSWYNLPRGGGIAYAGQESWVQNETIRDNILFGAPDDEERYKKVIHQCPLTRDLELFEAGDQTEICEKGLTLSGGQKASVTLARAVYSSAEIILLDDVLAALDVHTSKWIVDECLKEDLIRGRTVLLVTHNVAPTSPIADHIVSVSLDGFAHDVGTDMSAVLAADPLLAEQVEHEENEAELEKEVVDEVKKEDPKKDGKLILAEEIVEGRVTIHSMMLFLRGLGGNHPYFFLAVWILGLALMHGGNMFAVWFLGYWGSQYDSHNPEDIRVVYYLSLYSSILLASVAVYVLAYITYIYATMRASWKINGQLVDSVLGSTLRWLDETPAARIITRCTKDIAAVDSKIPMTFGAVVELLTCMIVKLSGPVIFTPIFLLPGIFIAVLGVYIGNIYLKAQMSVKREMSNARSPVLTHYGAAIAVLISICVYGAQQFFKTESLRRMDRYIKISRTSYNLNSSLASYLLIHRTLTAANIGFSLSMSLEFYSMILWLVRCYNDFEVEANSLERIQSYLDIEHEPKSTKTGKPPAAWPKSGDLKVEGLSARYSETGPRVLHEIRM